VAEQLSEAVALHATHAAPPSPHLASVVVVTQLLPLQHPPAHEVLLHTQAPAEQTWPDEQGLPVLPHSQAPVLEQLSDSVALHPTQAAPPTPHAVSDGELHVEPMQHPEEHAAAHPLHAPEAHVCGEGQAAHVDPPVPHEEAELPGSQVLPLQQPVGQDVGLHWHEPPTHCWPVEHWGPEPHSQSPLAPQVSEVVASQTLHAFPEAPHAESESVVVQVPLVPPAQHPDGHDLTSQTHVPDEQICPGSQGGLPPQAHAPVAVQVSATVLSHETHVPPAAPQLSTERAAHVSPMQQSPGHEVESQMHLPAEHRCPALQPGPVPQVHLPSDEQASPDNLQSVHAPPTGPQAASDGVLHVAPAQHPWGQRSRQLLHAPETHVSPDGHALQAPPPLPQALAAVPVSHASPRQQPMAHEVASHTHWVPSHLCPVAQAGPRPHPGPGGVV
jgi:hypothetical protein